MILTSDLDLHRPLPAAHDAVAREVVDELRRNGCTIRGVAPGVVEFDGPSLTSGRYAPFRLVSGGTLWLASGGRMRLTLRIRPLLLAVAFVAACASVAVGLPLGTRLVLLGLIAVIAWINVDSARAAFETWVRDAARRA